MSNLLQAFCSLVAEPQTKLTKFYAGSNRANNMGNALEAYIKDLFATSFKMDKDEADEAHRNVFNYLGNTNNPPDAVLKTGDAIEIKKIETLKAELALNSSYPKNKLYYDDTRIKKACREIENSQWKERDIIYIIGILVKNPATDKKDTLKGLWFIYGDCYAASKDIYENIANKVIDGIQAIPDLELGETNELGRVNRVDPLGITYLRVRGMWGIENPINVFSYLNLNVSDNFFAHAIMKTEKFNSFPLEDRNQINSLSELMSTGGINGTFSKFEENIKDPNNPANMIEATVLSYTK